MDGNIPSPAFSQKGNIYYRYVPKEMSFYTDIIKKGKSSTEPNAEKITIFDLDGTLSDDKWRRKFIDESLPDSDPLKWHQYQTSCVDDDLMNGHLIQDDHFSLYAVIFTGRPKRYKDLTTKWLWLNKVPYKGLYMREDTDLSPNWQVKEKLLHQLCEWCNNHITPIYPYMAYDDDPKVIEMYKRYGLNCKLVKGK